LGSTWTRWVVYWTCTGTLPVLHGIYKKTRGERVVETVDFFPEKFTLPFPSAQDLATQAVAELTRALLHPQPAGPFCKVGEKQTLALKRLADIFEGATRQKSKVVIPPTDRVENIAPPRVQHTVSPSEGGKHNGTTNTTTANHTITLNAKFSSPTTPPSQTCNNTTNTTCNGKTQCWPTT
jgi:hypothetical protein